MTEKKQHVYEAIAHIAGELAKTGIAKDKNNKMQGYKFRGIDDIYNALAKLLSENSLVILPRVLDREVTERTTKNGGALFYVVVTVEFDFVSSKDGSKHVIRMFGEAMDSGDKATNKAMSAAYKYACLEVFCIPTEGDNDADATTHEVKPKAKPKEPLGVKDYNMLLNSIINCDSLEQMENVKVNLKRFKADMAPQQAKDLGEQLTLKQASLNNQELEANMEAVK